MKVLGKRFLEEYVLVHCQPSTAYKYRRSVELFIDPRIGARKVAEIRRIDIADLHHGMRETPYRQPDPRIAVEDVQPYGVVGSKPRRLEPLPARRERAKNVALLRRIDELFLKSPLNPCPPKQN